MLCAGARLRALSVVLAFVAIKPGYHGDKRGGGKKAGALGGARPGRLLHGCDAEAAN
jgi:hypothetical protein